MTPIPRRWLVVIGLELVIAGCGGPTPTTATPTTAPRQPRPAEAAPPAPARTAEPGAPTGFANTRWAMTGAELEADGYRDLDAAPVDFAGREATARFTLQDDRLIAIRLVLRFPFADMGECGIEFAELRAGMDREHGRSQSDNLAAYWNTATSAIELACNPVEEAEDVPEPRSAILSIDYRPRDPE